MSIGIVVFLILKKERMYFHWLFKIGWATLIIYTFSSCTTLQWRASDNEIRERFSEQNIPTEVLYFNVDSLQLKVRLQQVTQSEEAVNIVFFHGSPSSLSAWNAYLLDTTLIRSANLVAVDRPGYGYSNFGDQMPSIQLQAEVMSSLIDHHQLKNVIAVGSSYGGPLAARLAVINPNIKAVLMISPAIDPKQEKKIWASRLTQWWLTRWLAPTGYRVAGDEKTVHAMELAKIEKDWGKVKVPVIHIHGDTDDIVPYGNVNYTAQKFSNIKVITTPNTGHEIAWARPELIIPHLLELVANISE
ncbi:MAG: alpha/beta hydrolase [Bacteroidota bacterium]